MRVVHGVDLASLPDQFNNAKAGRTLILDGDGPCYVASATAKRLDTALRNFQTEVLKRMFLTQSESCRIHLTASGSDKHGRFRVIADKPYQGNRENKAKPTLLEPLREAVADNATWLPEYTAILHKALEADDGMMQDAYLLKEDGVISSEDKDLRMTPYLYYESSKGQVMPPQPEGWVSLKCTDGGSVKLIGQGPMFFWGQMLAGDTADNVRGIRKLNGKLCGPAGAYECLKDITSVNIAANVVVEHYRAVDQNVLAEGWLLWLTRWRGDNVLTYLRGLDLSDKNRAFVEECLTRAWVKPKETNDRNE
jgi:hypothetical protein